MKRLSTPLFILIFVIVSISLIAYARGFRLDFTKKRITSTGLLVATSDPDGASVFLNGHLTTATNNTINLPPALYDAKIIKEGYLPWQKKLKIQPEIVTKTEVLLFPSVPSLKPLTLMGALNPSLSPNGTKIIFSVPFTSNYEFPVSRAGLWVFPLLNRPLSFARDAQQIAKSTANLDFSKSKIVWSPDSKLVLALFLANDKKGITPINVASAYLLSADSDNPQPKDITPTLSLTLNDWQNQELIKYQDQLLSLPRDFLKIATTSAIQLKFSPDESKVMYLATSSASLPPILKPPLIGASSQPEERDIKSNSVYVYDVKEDKNFKIQMTSGLSWFDSRHLLGVQKDAIAIMEYDGTNNATVYAGPFENSYVFPWPDGTRLVILTTLNKTAGETPNLYAVGLK